MTNTKWLRQALLGSVALGVMVTGAQADELSELKAQLEGLQSRVNQLEQQPAQAALPEGASFITFSRGSAEFPNYGTQSVQDRNQMPSDRGFTIAVTPTADLPAPIAEVVVYGYVKGDVIYDFDKDLGDTFNVGALWSSNGVGDSHVRLHAFQTRFGIRSRTDTAIGQIRTQVEGDFFGAGGGVLRLRHAYGEWDMTPNWTLLVGQSWQTAGLLPIGVVLVDFGASAGVTTARTPQVRMTYHSGPISWAVAIERPSFTSTAKWPNLASYLQFDAPGGHQFIVTGLLADQNDSNFDIFSGNDVGWAIQAGANVNLADIATLTVGGIYGEGGPLCQHLAQDFACTSDRIDADKGGLDDFFIDDGWGIMAGLSFGLTDTTTFNVQYGFARMNNDSGGVPVAANLFNEIDDVDVHTVHANILWRPVQQMQLGWEVMWGQYRFSEGSNNAASTFDLPGFAKKKDDAIRAQFGAWFFF